MSAIQAYQADQSLTPAKPSIRSDKVKAQLAYELAANLMPASEVFKRFGINKGQAKLLLANPQFKTLYAEAKVIWNSSDSAKERLRAKATLMVEDGLLELWQMFHDNDIAPPSRLDAFKQIALVANVTPKGGEAAGDTGPKFSLTINIPRSPDHEAKTVTIDANALGEE